MSEETTVSGNEASLSMRAPQGVHGRGAPLPGTLRGRWDFVL